MARGIVGAEPPPLSAPYFWSDQFALKLQVVGRPDLADSLVPLNGEGLDGGPLVGIVVAGAGDRLVSILGISTPRLVARYRPRWSSRPIGPRCCPQPPRSH